MVTTNRWTELSSSECSYCLGEGEIEFCDQCSDRADECTCEPGADFGTANVGEGFIDQRVCPHCEGTGEEPEEN